MGRYQNRYYYDRKNGKVKTNTGNIVWDLIDLAYSVIMVTGIATLFFCDDKKKDDKRKD